MPRMRDFVALNKATSFDNLMTPGYCVFGSLLTDVNSPGLPNKLSGKAGSCSVAALVGNGTRQTFVGRDNPKIYYRVWNGSSWSATNEITSATI
ncbi:Uncharacterised protein [Serratia plymuthica]|nr:Uncharacterised protein [Serratia plymuthica]